jgi:hypothetical protein
VQLQVSFSAAGSKQSPEGEEPRDRSVVRRLQLREESRVCGSRQAGEHQEVGGKACERQEARGKATN